MKGNNLIEPKEIINWDIDKIKKFMKQLNLKDKRVFICFESKSLGDNLAWVPYVEKFRTIHKCEVICSTFNNDLFEKESEFDLIKIDTQGSELDIITGGINLCKKAKGIF